MEWGCMQALIDFDGWRKWKDFDGSDSNKNTDRKSLEVDREESNEAKAKREKKEAKRAALLAKMG